jgi:transposase
LDIDVLNVANKIKNVEKRVFCFKIKNVNKRLVHLWPWGSAVHQLNYLVSTIRRN